MLPAPNDPGEGGNCEKSDEQNMDVQIMEEQGEFSICELN